MRLLVDANLSPRVAELLRADGHDAVHVRERGLQRAEDPEVAGLAVTEERVLVSEDTDFAALLAHSGADRPSLVLLRSGDPLTPDAQARVLGDALTTAEGDLSSGAIVVVEPARLRIRLLPLPPDTPQG